MTRRPALRRALAALLVAASAIALAACARIPTSGPVVQGDAVVNQDTRGINLIPDGPAAGASASDVVLGFLHAGTGTQNNYEIAREFLAPGFANQWDPYARVLITEKDPRVVSQDLTHVTVEVDAVAEVDPNGQYTPYATAKTYQLDFDTVDIDGQIRISSAQSGITLLEQNFQTVFTAATLSFFDAQFRHLVPDVRWFPKHQSVHTRIVQALLQGPAQWLKDGSVVSALPIATTLMNPVTVDGAGAAQVNFSPAFSAASPERFTFMYLQLVQSLRSVPGVDSVTVLINGAKQDVQLPPEDKINPSPQVNSTPVVYRNGELGFLSTNQVTPIDGCQQVSAALPPLAPIRGAIAPNCSSAAFLAADGVSIMDPTMGRAYLVDGRQGLAAPAIDVWGYTWSTGATGPAHIANAVEREHFDLELPSSIPGDSIVALQIARDGARAAALLQDPSGSVRLAVMAISRDPTSGSPQELGSPQIVDIGKGRAVDLTWVDQTSVAMLVDNGGAAVNVLVHEIGGTTENYGSVPAAVDITGSNTLAGLRVVDTQGWVYVPRGTNWQTSGAVVGFLVDQA